MKNNKSMYIKIIIYFTIFAIYSLTISLSTRKKIDDLFEMYKQRVSVFVQAKITGEIEEVAKNLKSFDFGNIDSIDKTSSNYETKIEEELNKYNELNLAKGNLYLIINEDEVYSSDYKFFRISDAQIDSTSILKELLQEKVFDNKDDYLHIYNNERYFIFYYLHNLYDDSNRVVGKLIKEINIRQNQEFIDYICNCDYVVNFYAIDENVDAISAKKVEYFDTLQFDFDDSKFQRVNWKNYNFTVFLEFDYDNIYKYFNFLINHLILGMICVVLIMLISFIKTKNEKNKGYKILIVAILIISAIYGVAVANCSIKAFTSYNTASMHLFEKHLYHDFENLMQSMDNGLKYIKGEAVKIYEKENYAGIINNRNKLTLYTRQVAKNVCPAIECFYITSDLKIFKNGTFDEVTATKTQIENFNELLTLENDIGTFFVTDEYDEKICRKMIKINDQKGNVILVLGCEINCTEYIKNYRLYELITTIENDVFFAEDYINNWQRTGILNIKNKENFVSNTRVTLANDEEKMNLDKLKFKKENIGLFALVGKKNNWVYFRMPYGNDYLIVTLKEDFKNNLVLSLLIYYVMTMLFYSIFFLLAYESRFSKNNRYIVKEYEIHSNY